MKDINLPLVDPTPDLQYTKRKTNLDLQRMDNTVSVQAKVTKPKSGWTKQLQGLPDFTDINIRTYATKSGKRVDKTNSNLSKVISQKTCVNPETRGYQLYNEDFIHDVWICVRDCVAFLKSKCFRSQKSKQSPHELWCAITCNQPSETVHAYCSCVAGASGFCNHVFGLLYQISHFSKLSARQIPDEISSKPHTWDEPRILGISPEPTMNVAHNETTNLGKKKRAVQSSLYEARSEKTIPNDSQKLLEAQEKMRKLNPLIGITYMATPDNASTEFVKTTMGNNVPVGSVLSYQLAIPEGGFDVNYD